MKSKRTISEIEPVLPEIKRILRKLYGRKLAEVVLYGSFVRGKANRDSDIDIAIVLKDRVNKSREVTRAADALYDLMLETGELISIYPVSRSELGESVWPLYRHIRNEGKRL